MRFEMFQERFRWFRGMFRSLSELFQNGFGSVDSMLLYAPFQIIASHVQPNVNKNTPPPPYQPLGWSYKYADVIAGVTKVS